MNQLMIRKHSQLREGIMEALITSVLFVGAGINFLAFKLKLNSYFFTKFWYFILTQHSLTTTILLTAKTKQKLLFLCLYKTLFQVAKSRFIFYYLFSIAFI